VYGYQRYSCQLPSRQCRLRIAGGLIARSRAMASRGRSLRLFHLNRFVVEIVLVRRHVDAAPSLQVESPGHPIFGLMVSTRTLRSLAVTGLLSRFTTNMGGLLTRGSDGPGAAGCFPLLGLVIGILPVAYSTGASPSRHSSLHYRSMR